MKSFLSVDNIFCVKDVVVLVAFFCELRWHEILSDVSNQVAMLSIGSDT